MNKKFHSLPEEKQLRILNAAMEVFAKYDYKHASTDLIAARAGISKGLLFHYFRNKQTLYLYLYNYIAELLIHEIVNEDFMKITDFFEILEYSSIKKAEILQKTPYIMDLALKSFYSEKEEVSDSLSHINYGQQEALFNRFMSHIDTCKFKDGICPYEIFKMLVWMTDGYLHELRMLGKNAEIPELLKEYKKWTSMLRQLVYKEEYL